MGAILTYDRVEWQALVLAALKVSVMLRFFVRHVCSAIQAVQTFNFKLMCPFVP